MPQRIINMDTLPSMILTQEDRRTLKRIKFDDEWERMNWYVHLCQKPLKEMTHGEISTLQEEIKAIERFLFGHTNPTIFSIRQISRLQKKIQKYLQDLINKGQTMFVGFKMNLWIVHGPVAHQKMQERNPTTTNSQPPFDLFSWLKPLSGEEGIIFEMGHLLRRFGASIIRCPHCSKIFLQLRKNADYCSRECQSRAYMRNKRAESK